jgi:hypothetical protein
MFFWEGSERKKKVKEKNYSRRKKDPVVSFLRR